MCVNVLGVVDGDVKVIREVVMWMRMGKRVKRAFPNGFNITILLFTTLLTSPITPDH